MDEKAAVETMMRTLFEQKNGLEERLREFRLLEEEVDRIRRESPFRASSARKLRQIERLIKSEEYRQQQEDLFSQVRQIQSNLKSIGRCFQAMLPEDNPFPGVGTENPVVRRKFTIGKFV